MNREKLLRTASKIQHPNRETAAEYASKSELLAVEMNRIFCKQPELESLIGPGNLNMMQENHRNHTRFIAALLMDFQPEVLVETLLWVFRAYRSHGFRQAYWPTQLEIWVQILKANLQPESFEAIHPIYDFMIANLPLIARLSEEFPETGN